VNIREAMGRIQDEIAGVLGVADVDGAGDFVDAIIAAKRIYVTGEGRSGIVSRTFAMRLVHLGFTAYVCGDTVTPAIGAEDLCIACSATGETPITCHRALVSHEVGSTVAAIVATPESTLASEADIRVTLPSPTKSCCRNKSAQFGSTLFEQSLLIFLDAVVLLLIKRQETSHACMSAKHANLE